MTALAGHIEDGEAAFLASVGPLADAAQAAGLVIALEIHGLATGALSAELLGRIDFGRVVEILRGAGYHGPYSVEIEFDGNWPPLDEVTSAMRASRAALAPHGLS
jgi:hypothetical protein